MKTKNIYSFAIPLFYTLVIASFFAGCKKDDDDQPPVIPNEEELITTLHYRLMPPAGGDTITLTFRDLDGDGGNPPVITVDSLDTSTTYNGYLLLLNETVSPADTISVEIDAEGADHQFFFSSDVPGVNINYVDTDVNGNPVGLKTTLLTGAAGSGILKITLRHEPDKDAAGVQGGDITNAGGETDIEVTFDLMVK